MYELKIKGYVPEIQGTRYRFQNKSVHVPNFWQYVPDFNAYSIKAPLKKSLLQQYQENMLILL
jgi:hypothetical protein